MKHFVKTSVATAVVLGTALIAGNAAAAPLAGSIVNTRHNLGSTGSGLNKADAASTAEICIFCHTPHGGDTGAPVPLWNKVLTTGNFSTYDTLGTSTLDAAVGDVGSVSLACLTCHDGTQAIDNIINAPGSGGFDTTGGGPGGLAWTWTSTDKSLDANGQFQGGIAAGNIWQIGTDLTNDHPVSMQYAGGGYSVANQNGGEFGTTTTRDADFNPAIPIGTAGRWYVDNTAMAGNGESFANQFDKWDFKLYTRDTGANVQGASANGAAFAGKKEPFVECGSCHDPHFQTTTFLRMTGTTDTTTGIGATTTDAGSAQSNQGSRVCLTCHAK